MFSKEEPKKSSAYGAGSKVAGGGCQQVLPCVMVNQQLTLFVPSTSALIVLQITVGLRPRG